MLEGLLSGMTLISIILLIAGFVLVGIEMTMPGVSAPGIAGSICLVASVFLIADSIVEGVMMTIVILTILGIMLAIILWLLSRGKLIRPIILVDEQHREKGYLSSADLEYLLNKEGVAVTDLRPTGIGNFEGVQFDIISEGQYITKGSNIVIYKVKGSKLIVKEKN